MLPPVVMPTDDLRCLICGKQSDGPVFSEDGHPTALCLACSDRPAPPPLAAQKIGSSWACDGGDDVLEIDRCRPTMRSCGCTDPDPGAFSVPMHISSHPA